MNDFENWTPEQIRHFAMTGEEPTDVAPRPSTPVENAPPGQGLQSLEQRNREAERRAPTGSFSEGFRRGAASAPFGVARLAGVEGAEDVAKMHGAEMKGIRATPFGAAGATAANVLTGAAALPARGYLANMAGGATLEGLQDFGEGKSGVEGVGRGIAGGFLGNFLANTLGTTGNAAWKAAGGKGRWDNDALEYVYDFAKAKGVDLRPGDVSKGAHRGFENLHVGAAGNAGLENESAQLYKALFGDGTKNELSAGLSRVDRQMSAARNALWQPLSQLPDRTPIVPTGLLTSVEDVFSKYPKLVNAIDNAEVKRKLVGMLRDKQSLIDQGYSPTSAHRITTTQHKMSFDEVREILTNLNPEIAKVKGQAAKHDIVKDAYVELSRMKDAVNGDLKRWGRQNPEKYDAYQTVLDTYKKEFVPYETNPYVVNWKAGVYDEKGPEKMVLDLLDPTKKTHRNQLLDKYIAPIDRDAAGYLRMLDVADRAGLVIGRGATEPGGGIPAMLSPVYTGARIAAHKGAGKTWMTPITGASNRVFSTQPGAVPNRLEGGLRGLTGLSWQELTGEE